VRHDDVPALDDRGREALDAFEHLAGSPAFCREMAFEPGDIQLINNHAVVHSRTGYTDDPEDPRHLLRLWLSFER
jgi:alpha-ketoglutarate-dependent taurine dioxygenase